MIIFSEYDSFINSNKELVELNIIRLIDSTLKYLKKEVIYSDVERRFYMYDELHWQPIESKKVISIYWIEYSKQIFPMLVDKKSKTTIDYNISIKAKDEFETKRLKNLLERYNFFIKLTQKRVKDYIESLSMACDRIPDLNYDKIPLQNGYIDIKDFHFKNLDPYIYNRYCLQFKYKVSNEEPKIFFKFLQQILPDEADREFLINWLAYMLVSGNHRQKALFFYGSGRNGKGVLSRIIYKLLGENNCSSLTVSQLSGEKYFVGQLNNKLLNISPDSDEKDKIDIGMFKTLTGNDNVTVRDIYGAPFNMIFTGKLLFSINQVPYFSTKDLAIMERLEILNFPVTIKEADRIPNFENIILEKEGDLIFNFLLERLKKLSEIDFKFKAPNSVKNFTNSIMDEQDNISDFLNDYLIQNDDEYGSWQIGLRAFYKKYKEYMIDAGYKTLNEKNFKENVLRWKERRKDLICNYSHNGKNYVFVFARREIAKEVSFNQEEKNLLNMNECPF